MWAGIKKMDDINDENAWPALVEESVKTKYSIVKEDPFEKGPRKILNFGHTVGHALESYSLDSDNPLLHGEAIALGMKAESYIAKQLGMISKELYNEIAQTINSFFELKIPAEFSKEDILGFIKKDKKNISGKVLFSLPRDIGDCRFNVEVGSEDVSKALDELSEIK